MNLLHIPKQRIRYAVRHVGRGLLEQQLCFAAETDVQYAGRAITTNDRNLFTVYPNPVCGQDPAICLLLGRLQGAQCRQSFYVFQNCRQ